MHASASPRKRKASGAKPISDKLRQANSLFTSQTKKVIDNLLKHVDNGCLSDPLDCPLYFKTGTDSDNLPIYRCVRGTNDVEGGVHQKLAMKFQSWNCGIELADAVLRLYRHRHNIRASEKHRHSFPKFGFYEHFVVDEIVRSMDELCLDRRMSWWWEPSLEPVKTEHFGVIPNEDLYKNDYEKVKQDSLQLRKNMADLARLSKTLLPYTPVCSKAEKDLYAKSVLKYLRNQKKKGLSSNYDWEKFAEDWNDGKLEIEPNGQDICRKTPDLLKKYFKSSTRRQDRFKAAVGYSSRLSELSKSLFESANSLMFPGIAKSKSIPRINPDAIIDLCESDDEYREFESDFEEEFEVDDEDDVILLESDTQQDHQKVIQLNQPPVSKKQKRNVVSSIRVSPSQAISETRSAIPITTRNTVLQTPSFSFGSTNVSVPDAMQAHHPRRYNKLRAEAIQRAPMVSLPSLPRDQAFISSSLPHYTANTQFRHTITNSSSVWNTTQSQVPASSSIYSSIPSTRYYPNTHVVRQEISANVMGTHRRDPGSYTAPVTVLPALSTANASIHTEQNVGYALDPRDIADLVEQSRQHSVMGAFYSGNI